MASLLFFPVLSRRSTHGMCQKETADVEEGDEFLPLLLQSAAGQKLLSALQHSDPGHQGLQP